jgi:biopolymer transport protein TolQ
MVNPIPHLAFLLLQLQDASQQAAAPASSPLSLGGSFGTNSALLEMLRNSGPVALSVLGLLLLASLHSWSILLGKWSRLRRVRAQSLRFLRAFRKATRLQEIATVSDQFKPSPLVPIFDGVYDEYRRQMESTGQIRSMNALERAAQNASSEALTLLERRMSWLATIGATAPFVGLFGTIMGIVDAFHGLGTSGGATLRAVAPGISEALITTAAGLFVAIPAVVGYNQFTTRLREIAGQMDSFARELLTSIDEIQAATAAAPANAASEPYTRQREVPRGLHR